MSIPKKIHYCWFGGKPLPRAAERCIASWKRFCPDYELVRWDESNVNIQENRYAAQAYAAGKWAFVSDYFRLKAVYEHGGVYLDTDVELIKSLDVLTERFDGFFGYEDDTLIATGLGFGAKAGDRFVAAMLADYADISFVAADGSFDQTPCPQRNTAALRTLGVDPAVKNQVIDNVCFLEPAVLCPIRFATGEKKITPATVSVHHYDASWCNDVTKRTKRLKRLIGIRAYDFLYGKFLHHSKRWEW